MSGDTKTTTQTSSSDPWEEAQPYIKTGLQDAGSVYSDASAWQPNTMSTVVPYSDQTTQGMNAINSQADSAMSGPNAFSNGFNFLTDLTGNGGLTGDQKTVNDMWMKTASGDELGATNPYFEDVLKRTMGDSRDNWNLSVAGAGRYGSPAHAGTMTDRMGGISSAMRMAEYNNQQGRMDNARTSAAGMGQQGVTNMFGANAQAPQAWQNMQTPARDKMMLGSMNEDLMARVMEDQNRIFTETRDAPKTAVEWLNALAGGAGSLGGSKTGTMQTPTPNPFLGALMSLGGYGLNKIPGL